MNKRKQVKIFEQYLLDDLVNVHKISKDAAKKIVKIFHRFLYKNFEYCNNWNIEYRSKELYELYGKGINTIHNCK